ncbi:MAG: Alpha/beta fold hydrolase [Cyanobacteriota bacterium erpe_2018_sw_21hr_WHONDRS-SW48-000092_B_bin.40]|jgi:acylglycerol lipase|nr:Alpha/beta fold hydrolase [Cyanobacteriota bacterium erpe_2018_sw_21hr_WHONDRS-SW48-000092_B_bin.40]
MSRKPRRTKAKPSEQPAKTILLTALTLAMVAKTTICLETSPAWAASTNNNFSEKHASKNSASENKTELTTSSTAAASALQKAVEDYQAEQYDSAVYRFEEICKARSIEHSKARGKDPSKYSSVSTQDRVLAHLGAGSAAYQNSHIKLAMKHYQAAYKLHKKEVDSTSEEQARLTAELTVDLGDVYYELEKYDPSIRYFKEALALSQGKREYLEIYMRSLEGLAACYFKSKRIKEALPIYEEMAWRDRYLYGPLSTQYGWSLRVLVDVYEALNEQDKAKQCFDRSVWIFRLADRDRLVEELEGKTKDSKEELVARLTERTVGIGTEKPDPELKAAYTGEITPPEALPPHVSHHQLGQFHSELPWKRKRIIMHQPAAMQWVNPDVKAKGIVVCIPGFGLHRSSFKELGQKLAEQGLLVYAYDVRGFGAYTSMKARDRIDLVKTIEDLEISLKTIRRDNPGLPIFVLGESMGGSIALQLTAKHPELIDGLIAAVPSSKRYRQWKLTSKIGLAMVTGNKEPINAAPAVVNRETTDNTLKHELAEDPESRFTATPEEFLAVSKFLSHNKKMAAQITKTPVIMYQGVHDLLIKPEGTINLFRKIGTLDKDLSLIGRSQHLLFEQGQFSNNLLNSLCDWIKNHSQSRDEKGNRQNEAKKSD